MKNFLPLSKDICISFNKIYMDNSLALFAPPKLAHIRCNLIYKIPKISFFILNFNSVNIEQLQYFYLGSQELSSICHKNYSESECSYSCDYKGEFVVHPLLPAIKNSQKQFYLIVLKSSKYSLSEVKKCLEKMLDSFVDLKDNYYKIYKDQVEPYIPTIKQFDQAVKDIKIMNKEVLKLVVDYLARFKLSAVLVDKILDFMKLDEIIFDTMEVSVLKALVLKERSHEQNIKHGVLLDMEQSIKNVEDNIIADNDNQELIKGNQVQESGNVEEYYC